MELDLSSNLPFCTASPLATVLAQGHQVNLYDTDESYQNLTTLQKIQLAWHFCFLAISFVHLFHGYFALASLVKTLSSPLLVNATTPNVLIVNMIGMPLAYKINSTEICA